MNSVQITKLRLRNQHLSGRLLATPADIVRHNGAVQSQDLPGARWAIGQRARACTDADVLRAYDDGDIIRTHLMRPTWHFVAPEDLRWIQALTGTRVHQLMAYRYRQLEIDTRLMRTAKRVFTKALRDSTFLTRQELAAKLRAAKIELAGERLAFIVMWAELDALICSGPMRGKQTTYALIEERIMESRALTGDEALAELALRFFRSHGPAQIRDFVFWSGLTTASTKRGIEIAGADIAAFDLDGEAYYSADDARVLKLPTPHVRLLPNYDEYLLAYRDGRHAGGAVGHLNILVEDLSAHFIVLDGHIVGGWKRSLSATGIDARVKLFVTLEAGAKQALDSEFERLEGFVGVPVSVTYT